MCGNLFDDGDDDDDVFYKYGWMAANYFTLVWL